MLFPVGRTIIERSLIEALAGRVYPAAFTELLEQVLRAGAILALLFILQPDTPERAVGTIVLGMACSELIRS